MTDGQKLEKAVSMLTDAFVASTKNEIIKKPMAKALHEVWHWFDEHEHERKPKGNSCPCKQCSTRRVYATMFDMHFWGEDCPHECEEFEKWKAKEKQEQNDELCSKIGESVSDQAEDHY